MQTLKIRCLTYSMLLSMCLLIIFSCSSSDISNDSGLAKLGIEKNSFNLSISEIESREKYELNDIFDSIRYIPLQTTRQSMFSKIEQLEVTNKYFFILDWSSKSILAFEKNGTFRFKLKSKDISYFAIDEPKEHIVFQDKMQGKVYTYDFNGRLVNSKIFPFDYTGLVYLDSNRIAYYRYFASYNDIKQAPHNILIADSNNVIKHTFLPYNNTAVEYTEIPNPVKLFYRSNQNVYFAQPCDNKIYYNFKNNTLPDYFTIALPEKYSLPNDFLVNNKYLNKRRQYFRDNPYQAYLIENIYIVDSLMSFEVLSEKWHDVFIYDLNKKKAISTFNFLSGPKNNCLPPGYHFLAADGTSFYRSVSAQQLFNVKQARQSQLNFATLPKQMQSFYQTQNNLSNPVLIQLFPKKSLKGIKRKA